MDYLYIVGIAFALSIDALAVSIIHGITLKNLKFSQAFTIAFFFGFFQALMPFLGWAAGFFFRDYIDKIDHWIAFILLAVISGKMIFEAIRNKNKPEKQESKEKLNIPALFTLAIATSIDALAIGLSFSLLNVSIYLPMVIIGTVTFAVCLTGVYIGDKIGHIFERNLEIIGGVVLILIGLRILISHLV